jgi:hypothetical protein
LLPALLKSPSEFRLPPGKAETLARSYVSYEEVPFITALLKIIITVTHARPPFRLQAGGSAALD